MTVPERSEATEHHFAGGHATRARAPASRPQLPLARFVRNSQEARLLIVHTLGADVELRAEVLSSQERLIELMAQGRAAETAAGGASEVIDRILVSGFTSIVAEHLIAGEASDCSGLKSSRLS